MRKQCRWFFPGFACKRCWVITRSMVQTGTAAWSLESSRANQLSKASSETSRGMSRSPSNCHISGCFSTACSSSRTLKTIPSWNGGRGGPAWMDGLMRTLNCHAWTGSSMSKMSRVKFRSQAQPTSSQIAFLHNFCAPASLPRLQTSRGTLQPHKASKELLLSPTVL